MLHLHLCAARRCFVFVMMMMSRPVADGGGVVAPTGVKWQLGLVVVVGGMGCEFQAVGDLALGHGGGTDVHTFLTMTWECRRGASFLPVQPVTGGGSIQPPQQAPLLHAPQ